jgi:hypothetical protein
MTYMHCQVRFADYAKWKASMDADARAQREAGIYLRLLWRGTEDPNVAMFVCEVKDKAKARAFLNPADVEKATREAGVSGFEWHFVEEVQVG